MSARVFTIPAGQPFVDVLAQGILDRAGDDPLALSAYTLLLPTRRACRSLRDAFLRRADGRPLLLPRMSPIGDIDDDTMGLDPDSPSGRGDGLDLPPTIGGLRRQLLLARLIMARIEPAATPDQAVRLAADLADLIDRVQTEGLSFDGLAGLVPEDLARHWQETLEFLTIVTRHWPDILAAEGALDPAERRNRVLSAQAEAWRAQPPSLPVIAAGSTGSIPATAELLDVIAGLPAGAVVLPGLDADLDEESWQALDEGHPQYGMRQLLAKLGVGRDAVALWPVSTADYASGPRRARLIGEIMRPAATSDRWRAPSDLGADALADLSRVDCPTQQDEAGTIALLLRGVLETPGATAALVTPDRALARRVAQALGRWGVAVDDSGGLPLAGTPVGAFLRLAADCALQRAAPLALLSLLKHPLAAGGLAPARFRDTVRRLEHVALRGPRPAPGFAGVAAAVEAASADRIDAAGRRALTGWLRDLGALADPFLSLIADPGAEFGDLLRAHVAFAEALAATDADTGAASLWRHDDGEALAGFVAELAAAAADLPPLDGRHYPAAFDALLAGRVLRPRHGDHPRLAIWGPLEARLQAADLIVLGGLNEGTWPAEPEADPWMSRPMRAAFGLPAPERRVGLAAHDFAQLAAAPRVVLTRSERVDGSPTVPSRWLLRLATMLDGAGLTLAPAPVPLAWAPALDAADGVRPWPPPSPRPPVAARPRRLSVTRIGTWMADPYALYAEQILKLRPEQDLEADPAASDRGIVIHRALSAFVAEWPGDLPDDAEDLLLAHGREAFGSLLAYPGVRAFWWPRFESIARWFVAVERARRDEVRPVAVEVAGRLTLSGPAGPFRLTAVADRIDRRHDGTLALIDYKTGQVPSPDQVQAGFQPQLPLEALIAAAGGFDGVAAATVTDLAYWRLAGGTQGGEVKPVGPKSKDGALSDWIDDAAAGLAALVARFDDPQTPYLSHPWPSARPRHAPYDHLARVLEWSAGGEDGE
ncbi:MAG: double-strand break repair protein AddB [Inquilinaceae bacterium]